MDYSPLLISLKTAALAALLAFVAGTTAGRLMAGRRGLFAGLLDGLLLLPLVLPPTVTGYGLLLLFGAHGVIGEPLAALGLRLVFNWPGVVLAAAVAAFPLMYQAARAGFEQLDPELAPAARSLGAGEARIFFKIMMPLARPALLAGALLAFARALGEFGSTLMLAGNIPGKTQTLPIAIFFAVEAGHPGEAAGWVLCSLGLSLGAVLALNLWLRRGTR